MAGQVFLGVLQQNGISLFKTANEATKVLTNKMTTDGEDICWDLEALDLLVKTCSTLSPCEKSQTPATSVSIGSTSRSNPDGQEFYDVILTDICITVLKNEKYRKQCGVYLHCMHLLETCYSHSSQKTKKELYDLCLHGLVMFNTEKRVACGRGEISTAYNSMDIHTTIHVLATIIDRTELLEAKNLMPIVDAVLTLLTVAESHVAGKVMGTVVPKLLKSNKDLEAACLHSLWETTINLFKEYGQKTYRSGLSNPMSNRPFLILCALADWLFPVDRQREMDSSILKQPEFWVIIQSGFYHANSLSRKRAMYLLKRILDITESSGVNVSCQSDDQGQTPVFWWKSEHREKFVNMWQDFMLLLETLEEKQVHVIKPLMPRLEKLISASSQCVEGWYLLHSSWVCAVVQRLANHESLFIRRWGVTEILQMDMSRWPLLEQNGQQFLCGALVAMLSEAVVYNKMNEGTLGSCPPAGNYLMTFFTSCVNALPNASSKSEFLSTFVHAMSGESWSGAPLVFVLRGMSQLSTAPLCGTTVINDFRKILADSSRNLDVHFRGAVQCYLASTVIRLLDQDKVGPDDLASFIGNLRSDESLGRGTTLWLDYVKWLQTVSVRGQQWSPLRIRHYVENIFVGFLKTKASNTGGPPVLKSREMLSAARYLLLACDANILPSDPSDGRREPLTAILHPLVDVLLTINRHVYMSTAKADHALLGLVTVFQEASGDYVKSGDKVVSMVMALVKECLDDILQYITRQIMSDMAEVNDIDSVALYTDALKTLSKGGVDIFSSPNISLIVGESRAVLQTSTPEEKDGQLRHYAAMVVQGTLAAILLEGPTLPSQKTVRRQLIEFWQGRKPVHHLVRPKSEDQINGRDGVQNGWGRVSAEYIHSQWHCIQLLLATVTIDNLQLSSEAYVEWCMDALDLVSGETVFTAMRHLVSKVSMQTAVMVIDVGWRKLQEEKRTHHFWPSYNAFIPMAFHHATMAKDDAEFNECHRNLAMKVFACGEEKSGMVNVLISHLCTEWQHQSDGFKVARKYINIIVAALHFGTIHTKGKRFQNDVLCFLTGLGDSLAINQLRAANYNDDCFVRAAVLSLLSKLNVNLPDQRHLAHAVLLQIISKHSELINVKTYRNFSNSLVHREKHRLIVAVLVLESFVQDIKGEVVEYLLEMLTLETQPSVRSMVEWTLIRLILRDYTILESLWTEIGVTSEKKTATLCSMFTIITHVTRHTEDKLRQEALMLKAIPLVLPWCTTHQFNSRTYALASLMCMWRTCKERHLEAVLRTHPIIECFVEFQMKSINNGKTTQKLLDNFFFHFDPIKDYSIQTLLLTLPKLTCIIDEEWINPQTFVSIDPTWDTQPASHNLPLINERSVLDKCEPGSWKVKFVGKQDDDITEGNVQKKMVPWRSMLPQQDLDLDQDEVSTKQQKTSGLVLVTSLIDKIPNLGGLCRTSEIFGVSEFVMPNLKFVEDKTFEMLSVTAHKWVPIKEVKAHHLKEYLMEMKTEGYTLVGVEQTANSVSLTDYRFPPKALLLLGNEKEGIPVDLIQLLDICVEIPQQGIIRSLNVHVSGALFVWEYTRQRLLATAQDNSFKG